MVLVADMECTGIAVGYERDLTYIVRHYESVVRVLFGIAEFQRDYGKASGIDTVTHLCSLIETVPVCRRVDDHDFLSTENEFPVVAPATFGLFPFFAPVDPSLIQVVLQSVTRVAEVEALLAVDGLVDSCRIGHIFNLFVLIELIFDYVIKIVNSEKLLN